MATIPGVTQQEMDRYNSLLFAGRRLTDEEKQFRADIAEKIKAAPPVVISQKPVFAEWILDDNIPEGTLDYVGLNIKGQPVEPEPEMKPLTDADKNMLDFVASQGASVQALAEIERDLRTAPAKVEGSSEMNQDIENIIDEIKRELPANMIVNSSRFFKQGMQPALRIVMNWTRNNSYVDERAIPELEALLK